MSELEEQLKTLIIETLELEDVLPADIVSDEPLFEEGLGLDSIDALEIGLAIQQRYGIEIDEDSEENRVHFASIASLARFVQHGMAAT
jgi:acyl carrier protein